MSTYEEYEDEDIATTQSRLDRIFLEVSTKLRTNQDLLTTFIKELAVAKVDERTFIISRANLQTYSPDLRQERIAELATQREMLQNTIVRVRKRIEDLGTEELLILQEYVSLETRKEVKAAMMYQKLRDDKITVKIQQQQKEDKEKTEGIEGKKEQQKKQLKAVARRVAADRSDETCSICLVPDSERSRFWIDENVTLYPGCGHMYHSECLNDWVIRKKEVSFFSLKDRLGVLVLFCKIIHTLF